MSVEPSLMGVKSFRRIIVNGLQSQRSAKFLRVMSRTSRLITVGIMTLSVLVFGIYRNELFPAQKHRNGCLSGMSFGRENYATLGAATSDRHSCAGGGEASNLRFCLTGS